MKKAIVLLMLMLLFLSTPPVNAAAAVSDLDISAVLPSLISEGENRFIESLGDQLYHLGNVDNASQAQGKIAVYMGSKNNFIERQGVQDQKNFNAFWFLVAYIIYAGYGAARISSEKGGITTHGFAAQESYNRTYIRTLLLSFVLFVFYLWGIDWVCTAEWLMSKGFTLNAINIMPDGDQHGLSYLVIALANIGIWAFMNFRDMMCYIVVMYLLWLICVEQIPFIGQIADLILIYGFILFSSRMMIAFMFMAGATAIETLGIGGAVIPYINLMGIIIIICIVILLIPVFYVYGKIMNMGHSVGMGRSSSVHNTVIIPKE